MIAPSTWVLLITSYAGVRLFRARCYVKLFIQVSQLKCDSLSILRVGFPVNTTPGVVVLPEPSVRHYSPSPYQDMDYNSLSSQVYD